MIAARCGSAECHAIAPHKWQINCVGMQGVLSACMRYANGRESQLKFPPIRPSRACAVHRKGRARSMNDCCQHPSCHCRRPSVVPRRVAAGGGQRRGFGEDRRSRIIRGSDGAAGAGFRCRSDPARSLDARHFRLLRPDLSARAISGDSGRDRVRQRRWRHHPPLARFRRLRLHPEAVRGRYPARRDREGDGRRRLGAAGHRPLRRPPIPT